MPSYPGLRGDVGAPEKFTIVRIYEASFPKENDSAQGESRWRKSVGTLFVAVVCITLFNKMWL
jgi:hypothetical protein